MNDSVYTYTGPRRTLEEALSEVERELQVRKRCYDRWVSDGKMGSIDAKDRFARLQAALYYLTHVDEKLLPPDTKAEEPVKKDVPY